VQFNGNKRLYINSVQKLFDGIEHVSNRSRAWIVATVHHGTRSVINGFIEMLDLIVANETRVAKRF
jgi:hypothetical protein